MARLRVPSEATVHLAKAEVAELHDVPEGSVIDWGNGYAILNVVFLDEPAPVVEDEPAFEATPAPKPKAKPKSKSQAKRIAVQEADEE